MVISHKTFLPNHFWLGILLGSLLSGSLFSGNLLGHPGFVGEDIFPAKENDDNTYKSNCICTWQ